MSSFMQGFAKLGFSRYWLMLPVLLLAACSQVPDIAPTQPGAVRGQEQTVGADKYYAQRVAEFKQQPTVDTAKVLREQYIQTSYYQPYTVAEQMRSAAMFEAIANKNWAQCLESTQLILADNYTSLNAHYGAMVCEFESKNIQQGEYHQQMLDSLIAAIWLSGDGKSAETAFTSISTAELYAFVQLHGFEVTGQRLRWIDNTPFDHMTINNPRDGYQFDWFFNISTQMAKQAQAVKP